MIIIGQERDIIIRMNYETSIIVNINYIAEITWCMLFQIMADNYYILFPLCRCFI